MNIANPDLFSELVILTGTILRAEQSPKARRPAYRLWIDFGNFGIKSSSAQITENYDTEGLIGTQVLAVVNFPPKLIAGFKSECLVLGAVDSEGKVILIRPDQRVQNGLRIA